jgi:thiamine biosynthesis lipoprotein
MKDLRLIMGMPIIVEVADAAASQFDLEDIFDYFNYVDKKFSTYKPESEISLINAGKLQPADYSDDMRLIFTLAAETNQETGGYFDIYHNGKCDPSGIVKGWSIFNAAKLLEAKGFSNFYVDAGGDIQAAGHNAAGAKWRVGIRHPFQQSEIVKVLAISNLGVATSGTYLRGQHIYNPKAPAEPLTEIVSLTVIGPDVYEADRMATAAFAMGRKGIDFIEGLAGFEGYQIDKDGQATMTSGFEKFCV